MSEYANAENPLIAPEDRDVGGDPFKLKPIPRRLFEGAINAWADTARMPRTIDDAKKFSKINNYEMTDDYETTRSNNNTDEEISNAWEEHNPDMATPSAVMASIRELGGSEAILQSYRPNLTPKELEEEWKDHPNYHAVNLLNSLSHHLSSENVPHAKYTSRTNNGAMGYSRGLVFHVQDNDGSSQIMAVNPTWHTEGAPLFEPLEDHKSRLSKAGAHSFNVHTVDVSSMHRNEIANSNDPESERSMIRQGYPVNRRSNAFFKGINDE